MRTSLDPAAPPGFVRRVLWLANRTAGSWPGDALGAQLTALLRELLPAGIETHVALVDGHAAVKQQARQFLGLSSDPAAIVVGGGGGTLRATIEAVFERPGAADRMRLAPLRLGSGNVLARRLGVPKDPFEGIHRISQAICDGAVETSTIVRCEYHDPGTDGDSTPRVAYSATMAGLGQFGRVPADLARGRGLIRTARPVLRALLGVESTTNCEYVLALLARGVRCAVRPATAETVGVSFDGQTEKLRLLAGVIMSFAIPGVPFDPAVGAGQLEAKCFLLSLDSRRTVLSLALAPRRAIDRARTYTLTSEKVLELRLCDRPAAGFFLDEDPCTFTGSLRFGIAGALNFVSLPAADPQISKTSKGTA